MYNRNTLGTYYIRRNFYMKNKIKSYLQRLNKGEELDSVQTDFVRECKDVDPADIMQAEQELLREGTSIGELQRLCDVHSALFHGSTTEEKIANAEKATVHSLNAQKLHAENMKDKRLSAAASLIQISGHPLQTFTLENAALEKLIHRVEQALENDDNNNTINNELLEQLRQIAIHYAKKGDLLYPHLNVQYGISGPSAVMWTVDDEIRDELNALAKQRDQKSTNAWKQRLKAVLTRMEEMIYKESNILFPNCALNFTVEEWYQIYRDAKDYSECFGVRGDTWEAAETYLHDSASEADTVSAKHAFAGSETRIHLSGGSLTLSQLTALLNTIPLEISFVDIDNINRYFNEGPKVFKRPRMALGREVFTCHPPKIEQKVRRIIEEFRAGTLDQVPVWMDKGGRTFLVTYYAVRDKEEQYLGTLELVQDMEFAKEHFR